MKNDQFEAEVANLVNQERVAARLSTLRISPDIARVARIKSLDMLANQTLSHDSPRFGGLFNLLSSFGIPFRFAGENIAAGQQTPASVMASWMASPGHRSNILSADYQEIGVGFAEDSLGNTYWTQIFLTR